MEQSLNVITIKNSYKNVTSTIYGKFILEVWYQDRTVIVEIT